MALRWHLLLLARGRREPGLWWLFETYSIALLLGQILPTAVGGDAVRAIDLARRTGARAEAVSSVARRPRRRPRRARRARGARRARRRHGHQPRHGDRARPRRRRRDAGRGRRALLAPHAATAAPAPAARRPRLRVAGPLRALYHALHAYRGHPGALALVFAARRRRPGHARGVDLLPRAWAWISTSASRRCSCSARCSSSSPSSPSRSTASACARRRSSSCSAAPDVAREDAFALGLAFFAVGVLTGGAGRSRPPTPRDRGPARQDWRVESSNVNLHAPSRARSGDALRGRGSGALERSRPLARAAAQILAHHRRRARPCRRP